MISQNHNWISTVSDGGLSYWVLKIGQLLSENQLAN